MLNGIGDNPKSSVAGAGSTSGSGLRFPVNGSITDDVSNVASQAPFGAGGLNGSGFSGDPNSKVALLTETNNRLKIKLIEMVKALDVA